MNLPEGWGLLDDLMDLLAREVPAYGPTHPNRRAMRTRACGMLLSRAMGGEMRHADKLRRLPTGCGQNAWAYNLEACAAVVRESRVYRAALRDMGVDAADPPLPSASSVGDLARGSAAALERVADSDLMLYDGTARNPRYLIRNGADGAMVGQMPSRVQHVARTVVTQMWEPLVADMDRAGLGLPPRDKTPKARLRTNYPDDGVMVHLSTRDIHVGEPGDADAYRQHVVDCVAQTLQRAAYAHGRIEQVLLTVGSDLATVDTAARTTTRGTVIPGAMSARQTFSEACRLLVDVVTTARDFSDHVLCIEEAGNHDAVLSHTLAAWLKAWAVNAEDVTVDLTAEDGIWTCHEWGDNMIASHHGHVRGVGDMPKIIPQMFPAAWGRCRWRYVYLGHRHHSQSLASGDDGGLYIYQTRSISRPTEYEHRHGWLTPASLESFVFSRRAGLVAHYFAS